MAVIPMVRAWQPCENDGPIRVWQFSNFFECIVQIILAVLSRAYQGNIFDLLSKACNIQGTSFKFSQVARILQMMLGSKINL